MPVHVNGLIGRFHHSLLAEVSHDEANWYDRTLSLLSFQLFTTKGHFLIRKNSLFHLSPLSKLICDKTTAKKRRYLSKMSFLHFEGTFGYTVKHFLVGLFARLLASHSCSWWTPLELAIFWGRLGWGSFSICPGKMFPPRAFFLGFPRSAS